MILEAIQIFTVAGSLAGFGALYLHYKQYKKQRPIIECTLYKSHYELIKNSVKDIVQLKASFVINNTGNSPTSIVDCFGLILHPKLTPVSGNFIQSSAAKNSENQNILPYDIKANGSTKIELSFSFEINNFEFLDRCLIPIDMRNPIKREYRDLPLAVKFVFKHTHGKFEKDGCVFRKDQSESEKVKGEMGPLLFSSEILRIKENELKLI